MEKIFRITVFVVVLLLALNLNVLADSNDYERVDVLLPELSESIATIDSAVELNRCAENVYPSFLGVIIDTGLIPTILP
jgi:hypothetical protein